MKKVLAILGLAAALSGCKNLPPVEFCVEHGGTSACVKVFGPGGALERHEAIGDPRKPEKE